MAIIANVQRGFYAPNTALHLMPGNVAKNRDKNHAFRVAKSMQVRGAQVSLAVGPLVVCAELGGVPTLQHIVPTLLILAGLDCPLVVRSPAELRDA